MAATLTLFLLLFISLNYCSHHSFCTFVNTILFPSPLITMLRATLSSLRITHNTSLEQFDIIPTSVQTLYTTFTLSVSISLTISIYIVFHLSFFHFLSLPQEELMVPILGNVSKLSSITSVPSPVVFIYTRISQLSSYIIFV